MSYQNITSFFDSNGNILFSLLSKQGDNNIEDIISYLTLVITQKDKRNDKLNINQLRKFYDTFLKIFNNHSEDEKKKKIRLLMLKANVEYSAKRLNTNHFRNYISNIIDIVISKEGDDFNSNLKALKLHLEALVAYYPKDKGENNE
jgi:CRISPR type III-A-associated protein Csm2